MHVVKRCFYTFIKLYIYILRKKSEYNINFKFIRLLFVISINFLPVGGENISDKIYVFIIMEIHFVDVPLLP